MDHVDRIQQQWRRERPDVDSSPQRVFGRLHRLAQALTAELVAVYEQFGLSEPEFDLLAALRRSGEADGIQPADLARSTMVTTGGLTKRLDRLEERGLVQRTRPGDGDGRAKLVRLTPEGRTLIDEAFTAHMANEARLLATLPRRDADALERILRTWLADFEDQRT
ncbi:MarR family transcriptional regulator [Calidifontibacter sp. DB0510]|uniref:MarR family transcriptional regulator n=1 Tax=Metallococcus carri TaxID=1656884 RepID=A0A967AZ35_9MICO|nr:MarR family transcriptional regulator [Metallococcus carri]NHN55731.1 MarR family transcriptional regulator [Metallococcus carri]NOP38580.1 MarR family transcriptional regulator [Calidifontibacter sp. DB2511S]